jgi:hypothetical protein
MAPPDPWNWATPGFDPERIAESLRYAMKGIGCDDKKLIPLVTYSPRELEAVRAAFSHKFGRDLLADIKSETSFNFQNVLLDIFKDPAAYDAETVYINLVTSLSDTAVLEILASRSPVEKAALNDAYGRMYGHRLEYDIDKFTSGNCRKLIQRLLQQPREPEGPIDHARVRSDAEVLYRAGEGKIGTDETTFIELFTSRSFSHLHAISDAYPQANKKHHTLQQAIESEFSLSLKFGLLSILTIACYGLQEFYAEMAHKAMKGIGTNDSRLIRVFVRCRAQLPEIKMVYRQRFKKDLRDAVGSETSGSYKQALCAMLEFR